MVVNWWPVKVCCCCCCFCCCCFCLFIIQFSCRIMVNGHFVFFSIQWFSFTKTLNWVTKWSPAQHFLVASSSLPRIVLSFYSPFDSCFQLNCLAWKLLLPTANCRRRNCCCCRKKTNKKKAVRQMFSFFPTFLTKPQNLPLLYNFFQFLLNSSSSSLSRSTALLPGPSLRLLLMLLLNADCFRQLSSWIIELEGI